MKFIFILIKYRRKFDAFLLLYCKKSVLTMNAQEINNENMNSSLLLIIALQFDLNGNKSHRFEIMLL